jgi:hypothetical protein
MTVITNTVARVFIRWSLCLWKALCLLIATPLCSLRSGTENTEGAPHLHYTEGCDGHYFGFMEQAFLAIASTLALGSVGFENPVNENGERLIWARTGCCGSSQVPKEAR